VKGKNMRSETATALYRHYDKNNHLLYVGISLNPLKRLTEHKSSASAKWVTAIAHITVEWFPSLSLAETAERLAIQTEGPTYNRAWSWAPAMERQRQHRTGTIDRRGDAWRLRWRDIDGTRHTKTFHGTADQAEAALRRCIEHVQNERLTRDLGVG
jgi:predicted GIY-YIG superfamily endonuclease